MLDPPAHPFEPPRHLDHQELTEVFISIFLAHQNKAWPIAVIASMNCVEFSEHKGISL
jgi:hypothetical protein